MSDGPRKSRYDTNPLPSPEEVTGVDTEGPTRRMDQRTDPARPRPTEWQQPYDTSPYATTPAPPQHGAYMPPPTAPPAIFQGTPPQPQQYGARPPSSLVTQLGITQNFAAMASYAPFIGIVPAIMFSFSEPPEHVFARFHARQALFAHVVFWAISIAFGVARNVLPGVLGVIFLLPQLVFFLGAIGVLFFLMYTSYNWKTVKLPVIGDQVS